MNTHRLRVLMITGRADPGGGPEHLFQLVKQIGDDCEVFIATPDELPYWDRFVRLIGRARVFEIPHRRFSWEVLRQLATWCRLHRIEVVHSHGRAAGAYARLLPRHIGAIVHTPHGSLQLESTRDFAYLFAELLLARLTSHFIAVSQSEAAQLRRRLSVGKRLTVIPNGVVLPNLTAWPRVCTETPLRLVHVTRFVPQKNSGMVLEILTCLRRQGALERFHVDMLGDGPERARLEAQAQALGVAAHVTFHGTQGSVAPFLLHGFCLLTTSRWEGMPLAVLESLAHGLPVIASDTPGNNDVVTASVGSLFNVERPTDAARSILELAQSPTTWKRQSLAANALAKRKFSVERMSTETVALYQKLSRMRLTRLQLTPAG